MPDAKGKDTSAHAPPEGTKRLLCGDCTPTQSVRKRCVILDDQTASRAARPAKENGGFQRLSSEGQRNRASSAAVRCHRDDFPPFAILTTNPLPHAHTHAFNFT